MSIPMMMPMSRTCRRCRRMLLYEVPHDEVECDRRSLRIIVSDMRNRIRGGVVTVDGALRDVITTDGVHTRGPVARGGFRR